MVSSPLQTPFVGRDETLDMSSPSAKRRSVGLGLLRRKKRLGYFKG